MIRKMKVLQQLVSLTGLGSQFQMLGLLEVEGLESMRALRNNFQICEWCTYYVPHFTQEQQEKTEARAPARLLRSSQF